MNPLDTWLNEASRCLSRDAILQVRIEIREHYESARDAALDGGATADKAAQAALIALGDAKVANRQYRKVLLTSSEARLLREGNWEARMICSRLSRFKKPLLFSLPVLALLMASFLFVTGSASLARILLIAGAGMGFLFTAPFLPIYTPARSRAARFLKWIVLVAMPLLAFGSDAFAFSWLIIAALWPVTWIEWTRISIRRKLPLAQWPRHLYL